MFSNHGLIVFPKKIYRSIFLKLVTFYFSARANLELRNLEEKYVVSQNI